MTDNTEDRQLTEGWDPTYTGNQTYDGLQPKQSDTNDVPCTDWVRQQVLNHKAKAAGYEGSGEPVPLGGGWSIKLASPASKCELATTEYVDQQVADAEDSIRNSMAMSAKWVNRRIEEEKASAYRFLLNLALWFLMGLVISMLFWWWYG